MIELLLYTNLNCKDASDIISRVKSHEDMSNVTRTELVETLRDSTPHCKWDAND
jgi:hypothetical protein